MALPDDPIVNRNDSEVGLFAPEGWACTSFTENEALTEIPIPGNFGETLKTATVQGNSTWDWVGHKLSASLSEEIEEGDVWDFSIAPWNWKKFKVLRVGNPQPATGVWDYPVRLEAMSDTPTP